jgi:hypothetical protein
MATVRGLRIAWQNLERPGHRLTDSRDWENNGPRTDRGQRDGNLRERMPLIRVRGRERPVTLLLPMRVPAVT